MDSTGDRREPPLKFTAGEMRCSRRCAVLLLSLAAVGLGTFPAFPQNEQRPFSAEQLDQILAQHKSDHSGLEAMMLRQITLSAPRV